MNTCGKYAPGKRLGFTLIELLVVVAIIALLISILLPSLGKARQLAKTVKCAAQIKSINLAMTMYSTEYNGAILGNAHTSGAFLLDKSASPQYGDDWCPNISQCWDWMAPVGKYMNLKFDERGNGNFRRDRYEALCQSPALVCPENDILAPSYSGAAFQVRTTTMISYNTASYFQYAYGPTPPGVPQYVLTINFSDVSFGGYSPRISFVGNPSSKVFIADGAKYSNSTAAPDVDLDYLGGGSPGGAYSDYGPWSGFTRSYYKANGANGPSYAMRHGNRNTGLGLASYKFNLGFFDGHVETMNGLQGADPAMWVPKGSVVNVAPETPPEVSSRYFGGGAITVN